MIYSLSKPFSGSWRGLILVTPRYSPYIHISSYVDDVGRIFRGSNVFVKSSSPDIELDEGHILISCNNGRYTVYRGHPNPLYKFKGGILTYFVKKAFKDGKPLDRGICGNVRVRLRYNDDILREILSIYRPITIFTDDINNAVDILSRYGIEIRFPNRVLDRVYRVTALRNRYGFSIDSISRFFRGLRVYGYSHSRIYRVSIGYPSMKADISILDAGFNLQSPYLAIDIPEGYLELNLLNISD